MNGDLRGPDRPSETVANEYVVLTSIEHAAQEGSIEEEVECRGPHQTLGDQSDRDATRSAEYSAHGCLLRAHQCNAGATLGRLDRRTEGFSRSSVRFPLLPSLRARDRPGGSAKDDRT